MVMTNLDKVKKVLSDLTEEFHDYKSTQNPSILISRDEFFTLVEEINRLQDSNDRAVKYVNILAWVVIGLITTIAGIITGWIVYS